MSDAAVKDVREAPAADAVARIQIVPESLRVITQSDLERIRPKAV